MKKENNLKAWEQTNKKALGFSKNFKDLAQNKSKEKGLNPKFLKLSAFKKIKEKGAKKDVRKE